MEAHITYIYSITRPKHKPLFIKDWNLVRSVKSKVTNFLWKLKPLTNQAKIEVRKIFIKHFNETKEKFNEHMNNNFNDCSFPLLQQTMA